MFSLSKDFEIVKFNFVSSSTLYETRAIPMKTSCKFESTENSLMEAFYDDTEMEAGEYVSSCFVLWNLNKVLDVFLW